MKKKKKKKKKTKKTKKKKKKKKKEKNTIILAIHHGVLLVTMGDYHILQITQGEKVLWMDKPVLCNSLENFHDLSTQMIFKKKMYLRA